MPDHPAQDFRTATRADLPPGGIRCVDVDGRGILIARGPDGAYYALDRLCSHNALAMDGGRVRGTALICPHHGGRFELATGRAIGPPALDPIGSYELRERDGTIEVRLLPPLVGAA